MNHITRRATRAASEFGKAFLMTTTTPSTASALEPTPALVAAATETAAHDQADAAAAHRAATAASQARREGRQMAVAWASLFFGLIVSLGVFGAIAWQHSEAANGPGTTTSAVTPVP